MTDRIGTAPKADEIVYGGTEQDILDAINNLLDGREREGCVKVIGNVTLNSPIDPIPSYTCLDLSSAYLELGDNWSEDPVTPALRTVSDCEQTTIFGGKINGRRDALGGNDAVGIRFNSALGQNGDYADGRNRILFTQIRGFGQLGVYNESRRSLLHGVTVADCGDGYGSG